MGIDLTDRASRFPESLAISAHNGDFTYSDLQQSSDRVASSLLAGGVDLAGSRVAFLVPATFDYVAVQWGIWKAGGIAVPLCMSHPEPELEYMIADCDAQGLVAAPDQASRLLPIARRRGLHLRSTLELLGGPQADLPDVEADRAAMIVYTSGTTGGPKGVVTTHDNIRAQIESLIEAWGWRSEDRILLVLPLHHVHGIINILGCSLWAGATCEMMPGFDAVKVWEHFSAGGLSLFMAVPTIYAKLATAYEGADEPTREVWSRGCRQLRLMVSGSAALPVQLLERWREISGHTLLERYGMTEIGMALSNPLDGDRIPGHVGRPLPGVEVRRVDPKGRPAPALEPGEIEVKGPGVFVQYWARPEETARSFRDGWFRTGDVAVVEDGSYRILGRQSVDIIKTGGYKVSALEIEEILRQHPEIRECAVVGIADPEWGERVAVAVVTADDADLSLEPLRNWSKERLAPYKAPSRLLILEELPRNPMGKVTKPALKKLFESIV
jgi:malonyl-CoA/methylmalonyl-CoA synthetase